MKTSKQLCVLLFFFNTISVPVGVSQVLTPPPAVRMLPESPSLHPHVEGPGSLNKDAQRLGSLEPRHRVRHSYLGEQSRAADSAEGTTSFLGFSARATWNWRNLFRTPSARSGATAPCPKLRGPRTKVSVTHPNICLLPPRSSTQSPSLFCGYTFHSV